MTVNVITWNLQLLFQLPIDDVITRSDNNCSAVITQRGACVITRVTVTATGSLLVQWIRQL